MNKTALAALLLLASAPALYAEGWWWGPPENKSIWRDREIKVDGYSEDWRSQTTDDAGGFDFAFANDADNLYVMLLPHTKTTRAQLSGEFGQEVLLWLDPRGGKARKIGLRLPPPEHVEDGRLRPLTVYGVAVSTAWAEPAEDDAVALVMGSTLERGALEGRIPLKYLGTPLPRKVGIGLLTGTPAAGSDTKTESEEKRSDSSEQEHGGGGFHMGGARHGGRHGGGGMRHEEAASAVPLELWIQVWLAKPPRPRT